MKPCSKNRELIAWLAVDALDARQSRDLRAHMESCQGCREYLAEISNVTKKLATETESNVRASEAFHQKLVARLRAEETVSVRELIVSCFRAAYSDWRIATPMIAVALVMLVLAERHRNISVPAQTRAQVAPRLDAKSDPEPTFSNYQMIANKSLDELDEVLTRQGNRNLPRTQIYTASTLPRGNTPD